MRRAPWLKGLLVVGLLLCGAGLAKAERVPMIRNPGQRSKGTRVDITVDFLAPTALTGRRAFGAWSVGPRQYSAPDVTVQGARPVYNVIIYGGVQTFGSRGNGAAPSVIIR